jgi:hypothetical protein
MARAKSGMGHDTTQGHPGGSRTETKITDESELGSDMAGDNRLQGNDQRKVHNQRQTWPDEKRDPDRPSRGKQ